jgi:hypothetical protein
MELIEAFLKFESSLEGLLDQNETATSQMNTFVSEEHFRVRKTPSSRKNTFETATYKSEDLLRIFRKGAQ